MPEKPEVLTVVKSLNPKLVGREITDCRVYWDNTIAEPCSSTLFQQEICGEKIQSITTRGKWIVLLLTTKALLIHLRMEGKFFFRMIGDERSKHEHVVFTLDGKEEFRFHDVRKFGKMHLIPKEDVYRVLPLSALGYEYDDPALTKEYLYSMLHHKKIPIKTALLDQTIIAGIGNIYDDEILFLSHIHPKRASNKVTKKECQLLIDHTKVVMEKAIRLGGSTIKSFTSSEGVHGLFQNELLVHGKQNENCPQCGTKIVKTQIGGRGTYFCSTCQK